jgi:hypothetical protein
MLPFGQITSKWGKNRGFEKIEKFCKNHQAYGVNVNYIFLPLKTTQ